MLLFFKNPINSKYTLLRIFVVKAVYSTKEITVIKYRDLGSFAMFAETNEILNFYVSFLASAFYYVMNKALVIVIM